jgi:hypothetical protein
LVVHNRFRRTTIIEADWADLRRAMLRVPVTKSILGVFNPRLKTEKCSISVEGLVAFSRR